MGGVTTRNMYSEQFTEISCSTIMKGNRNGLTSAKCCDYSYVCSWWWVELPLETCTASSLQKYIKLYIVASCWTIIHSPYQCFSIVRPGSNRTSVIVPKFEIYLGNRMEIRGIFVGNSRGKRIWSVIQTVSSVHKTTNSVGIESLHGG
jgi:hypothetical protein